MPMYLPMTRSGATSINRKLMSRSPFQHSINVALSPSSPIT